MMKRIQEWAGVLGLLLSIFTIASLAMAAGARNAAIDQKVDKAEYERQQGQILGELRVLRTCIKAPQACP